MCEESCMTIFGMTFCNPVDPDCIAPLDSKLTNPAGFSLSVIKVEDHKGNIKPYEGDKLLATKILINNATLIVNGSAVIPKWPFLGSDFGALWDISSKDEDDYVTIKHVKSGKFLVAEKEDDLTVQGIYDALHCYM